MNDIERNSQFVNAEKLDDHAEDQNTPEDLSQGPLYEAKPLPRLGEPSINLSKSSRALPKLEPKEEIALIKKAKAGDRIEHPYSDPPGLICVIPNAAARKLVDHHVSSLQGAAYYRWDRVDRPPLKKYRSITPPKTERALQYEDFVAVALEAFWEAVRKWKPRNGLNAFARHHVSGALSDVARDWRNKPALQMDSRLQRYISSHPHETADWIKQNLPAWIGQPSIAKIEREQNIAKKNTFHAVSYNEGACDDERVDGVYESSLNNEHQTLAEPTAQPTGPLSKLPARGYDGGPVSEWSRGQAQRYKFLAALQSGRNRKRIPKRLRWVPIVGDWLDLVCIENRSRRCLKTMGRQAYADWLINRKSTCPVQTKTPSLISSHYSPPPVVRHVEPWGEVYIPRQSGPPLLMPLGQEPASTSTWNNRNLSRLYAAKRSLNLPTVINRFEKREAWATNLIAQIEIKEVVP